MGIASLMRACSASFREIRWARILRRLPRSHSNIYQLLLYMHCITVVHRGDPFSQLVAPPRLAPIYPCCATLRIRILMLSMIIKLRESASSGTVLKRRSNASLICSMVVGQTLNLITPEWLPVGTFEY